LFLLLRSIQIHLFHFYIKSYVIIYILFWKIFNDAKKSVVSIKLTIYTSNWFCGFYRLNYYYISDLNMNKRHFTTFIYWMWPGSHIFFVLNSHYAIKYVNVYINIFLKCLAGPFFKWNQFSLFLFKYLSC